MSQLTKIADLKKSFYQETADVIGIFWQFHDERVRLGNIPFAATTEYGNRDEIVPFSPHRLVKEYELHGGPSTFEPISEFNESIVETMDASYQQFLLGNGLKGDVSHLLQYVPVPEVSSRFFDPFVAAKIKNAISLYGQLYMGVDDTNGEQVADIMQQKFGTRLLQGMNSGTNTSTQLDLLFREEFKPIQVVAMSKIGIDYFRDARTGIGMHSIEPSYPLLDNSSLGLDKKKLRLYGTGSALGCPASMKVSDETQVFLAARGIDASRLTMLGDYSEKLPCRVETYLGKWVRGLTPMQRESSRISQVELSLLGGEVRRTALEQRAAPSCPYRKERL